MEATATFKNSLPQFVYFTLLLLLVATMSQAKEDPKNVFQKRIVRAQEVMAEKGYRDMAYMLYSIQSDLEFLDMQNKTYTIFAPDGASFWGTFDSDPPLSIVRYHIVPTKVDKDLLVSSVMAQQKINTLLRDHPLVVTTGLPQSHTKLPSLNLVTIEKWDVYNDGHLIVHGLGEFFDPVFQTTYYPGFSEHEAPTSSPTIAPQATFSPSSSASSSGVRDHGIPSLVFSIAVLVLLFFF